MKKFVLLLVIVIIVGCSKKSSDSLSFQITLPQTNSPQNLNQWGVTKFGPLKLREEPKDDSTIINHLPLGAVFEVIKEENSLKTFENIYDYWYFIDYKGEKGWIFGYYLDIYNKEDEAIKRSEALLFGGKLENGEPPH